MTKNFARHCARARATADSPIGNLQLDPAFCWQAVYSRDQRFDGRFFAGIATTGVYCRPICPVSFGHPESVQLVSIRRGRGSGWFSTVQALSPGHLTREFRLVWNLGSGFPRAQADFRGRAGWRQFGAACRTRGDRIAASSAALSAAPGRFSAENCAIPSRARRAKPDRGNATSGHRNCARHRFSEHSPIQSFRANSIRAVSHGASTPSRNCHGARSFSRNHCSSTVSPAFRLGVAHPIFQVPRYPRCGIRRRRNLSKDGRNRRGRRCDRGVA